VPNHIGTLCTGLIAALKARLFAPDFLERHRRSEEDFTSRFEFSATTTYQFDWACLVVLSFRTPVLIPMLR